MIINMCGLNIEIKNRYEYLSLMCDKIILKEDTSFSFSVFSTEEEIDEEERNSIVGMSRGAYEATVVFRKICLEVLNYNGIMIHSAVVGLNDEAYGFIASSGTGKTTHTRLWLEYFKEQNVRYINGDKPIYRFIDGNLYVCGHPWAGKEGYHTNENVLVKGLCFLERGKTNSISRIDPKEVVKRLFKQLVMPDKEEQMNNMFDLLTRIVNEVPFYLLKCNISLDAVKTSYEGMKG